MKTEFPESILKDALMASKQVLYEHDFTAGSLRVFGDIASIFGFPPEESGKSRISDIDKSVHSEDLVRVSRELNRAQISASDYAIHYRLKRADSALISVLERGRFIQDPGFISSNRRIGVIIEILD